MGDIDVCALVLINGQSVFTCGDSLGRYDLLVPPDSNGNLLLQAFVAGQAPFRKTISASSTDTDIVLQPASPDSKSPSVVTVINTQSTKSGWARISGIITSEGNGVCALALANGQRVFTCGNSPSAFNMVANTSTFDIFHSSSAINLVDNRGIINMDVPLNSFNQIDFMVFISGFLPFRAFITIDERAQTPTVIGSSGNPVELEGTWATECFIDTNQNASVIFEQTFEGFTLSRSENFWFSSTDCSGQADLTFRLEADFTLGDLIKVNIDGIDEPATKIDIDFSNAWIAINNSLLVDTYNTNQVCGINDWLAGVDQNILGTDCAPDSSIKDIVHINQLDIDELIDRLFFGDRTGPSDSDGYPTKIDKNSKLLLIETF